MKQFTYQQTTCLLLLAGIAIALISLYQIYNTLPNPVELAAQTHARVNQERVKLNLINLTWDPALANVAQHYAQTLANNHWFNHTGPDGSTVSQRYENGNYTCLRAISCASNLTLARNNCQTGDVNLLVELSGENLYATHANSITGKLELGWNLLAQQQANRVVDAWLASPAHYEAMTKDYWLREGIGVVAQGDSIYFVENFC